MAIPTEYDDNATVVGSSDIKHPIIKFTVIMQRQRNETIGPITNSKGVNLLHPDMHQNSPDRGVLNAANHQTQFQPFIPGYLRGDNLVRNDDGSFVAYGQLATYLKTQYADIANPLLNVENSAPYTDADV